MSLQAPMETTGNYPLERREGEIERLHVQDAALEFDAVVMLERIGVGPGWHCLDLGCGPGGMVELLSARTGPTGRVLGLDADPVFLDHAQARARDRGLSNVRFVRGDAYRTGLPQGSFDLVHTRFLASTVGLPEALFAEAIALARPGGIVAFQEVDIGTLKCHPPHPAWEQLAQLLEQAFACAGADLRLGQRLYRLAQQTGLEDVQYRPFLIGIRSCDPMANYLPSTIESVHGLLTRHELIDQAELDAALTACRTHLADPATVSTFHTVTQVWGRRPAGPR